MLTSSRTALLLASLTMAAASVVAPAAEAAPASAAELAQARALLDRWLAAQNRRDFAAYEAMYAATFTGIKRVGAKAKKLDRAGWLKDRKGMFKAAMVVTANDLAVTRDGPSLMLEFEQRWEQGSFGDVGRKRLFLDLHGAAGPILAEELLSSRPVLTETACRRAVFPRSTARRIGAAPDDDVILKVEVVDLDDGLAVCRVDHRAAEDEPTVVEVAALGSGKRWRVLAKQAFDLALAKESDEGSEREELSLEAVALTAKEHALLVEVKQSKDAPMVQERSAQRQLLRVTRKGFTKLLEFTSRSSLGEAGDGQLCKLEVTSELHQGMPDLVLACVSFTESWHDEAPDDRGRKEHTEETTYRWTGDGYDEP